MEKKEKKKYIKYDTPKVPVGRPEIKVDWKRLDELLTAGCSGTECAAYLGMAPESLYNKTAHKYGCLFTEYMQSKRACGDSLIREQQYLKAIGATKKGDNSMLVWLGKNRLNQKDDVDRHAVDEKSKEALDKAVETLNFLQKKAADDAGAV